MGLETRGKRPDPKYRGGFARCIFEEMDRAWRIELRTAILNDQRDNPLHTDHTVLGKPYSPRPQGSGPKGIMNTR